MPDILALDIGTGLADAFAEVPVIPALEVPDMCGLEVPDIPALEVGNIVEVHGLIQAPQFNGRQGRLVRFVRIEGLDRWVVRFDDFTKKNVQALPTKKRPGSTFALHTFCCWRRGVAATA